MKHTQPPHDEKLEKAVLGACLICKLGCGTAIDVLENYSSVFYNSKHETIYKSIKTMHANNMPIDILTLTHYLRTAGELDNIGGAYYLSELIQIVNSSSNTGFHCFILLELWIRRMLFAMSQDFYNGANDLNVDVLALLQLAEKRLQGAKDFFEAKRNQTAISNTVTFY
jgi:replicative DNA helicase